MLYHWYWALFIYEYSKLYEHISIVKKYVRHGKNSQLNFHDYDYQMSQYSTTKDFTKERH